MFEPDKYQEPFLDREMPDSVGWWVLAGAIVFLYTLYDSNMPKTLFLGIFSSFVVMGFLGLGGMRIKSYLMTAAPTVTIIFGLSFLFIVSRTQIPEELLADQVLTEIAAQELELFDRLSIMDTDPEAVIEYQNISSAQTDIRALSDRGDMIWAGIEPGTVIRRNNVPVGAYRDVVDIRDEVRAKQKQLDGRKRAFALERSVNFETPEISRLVAEQKTLVAKQALLDERIEEFEASTPGKFRFFSEMVMLGLVVLGFIGFFWLILSSS